jgi:argininosuccinate lyase
MGPVWKDRLKEDPLKRILQYCAGRDVKELPMSDQALIPYDIWTNRAHCVMLLRRDIIGRSDARSLLKSLEKLSALHEKGKFTLDPEREDVHMNVEFFLKKDCGESIGMKIHTGRSRNDQVACDVRMYLRDKVLELVKETAHLVKTLLEWAADHLGTVMPGFSHTRHAAVTTFGHLLCSYAQALERDLGRLRFTYSMLNRNPLGAAAGFGTSWPLDRELTTELLGFSSCLANSLDAIGSLWEAEAQTAEAISFLMNHLSVLCQDFLFLSTPEAGMVEIPDRYVTGSSIMPQKRNPDVLEVTRAKAGLAQGALVSLFSLGKGLLSGYNRDVQYGKSVIMDLIGECEGAPGVLAELLPSMAVDAGAMEAMARKGFLNAVDFADALARDMDLPFRQAYRIAGQAVKESEASGEIQLQAVNAALKREGIGGKLDPVRYQGLMDPAANVSAKNHIGGPAPDAVKGELVRLGALADEHTDWFSEQREKLTKARSTLESESQNLMR